MDYDNYVSGLLLPQETRDSFFAIRAVNAEIASIKDSVRSNVAAGKMRMQWWREKIYDLYDRNRNGNNQRAFGQQDTVLLRALNHAIHEHNLTRRWFERLIEARDADLDVDHPETLRELEVYAEKTASSLLYLTLECLDIREHTSDQAASYAGMAIGLTTLLRGTPHHSIRRQIYLPEELFTKHNVEVNTLFDAVDDPEVGKKCAPIVYDVACQAMSHLHQARLYQKDMPSKARTVFLSTVGTSMYLKELENVNFNVFDPRLKQEGAKKPLKFHYEILKKYFVGKY